MPKIIIIANIHPNESIALKTALRVARMLEQNPENEVIIERIPFSETNLGFLRRVALKGKRSKENKLDHGRILIEIGKKGNRRFSAIPKGILKEYTELRKKHGEGYYFEVHSALSNGKETYEYPTEINEKTRISGELETAGITFEAMNLWELGIPNINLFEINTPYKKMPHKQKMQFINGIKRLRLSPEETINHYKSYFTRVTDERALVEKIFPELKQRKTQLTAEEFKKEYRQANEIVFASISKSIAMHIQNAIKSRTAMHTPMPATRTRHYYCQKEKLKRKIRDWKEKQKTRIRRVFGK